ncbi:MAG: hypothetical protein QOI63_1116, partial [Thermoplasmata archaeon]|nr:hypothetical protein [Thermoplasmata archaeon]
MLRAAAPKPWFASLLLVLSLLPLAQAIPAPAQLPAEPTPLPSLEGLDADALQELAEGGHITKESYYGELARRGTPSPALGSDVLPPEYGLFAMAGLAVRPTTPGQPAMAILNLGASEAVGVLTVHLAHADPGLDAQGGLAQATLAPGNWTQVGLILVPSALGDASAAWAIESLVRGTPVTRTLTVSLHVDPDATRSTMGIDLPPLPPPPGAAAPQAASAPAPSYTGNRDQPIVFLNGFDPPIGDGSVSGKDVDGEWAPYMTALQGWGWSGQMGAIALGGCDQDFQPGWNTELHGKPGVPDIHALANGAHSEAANHRNPSECDRIVLVPPVGPPVVIPGRPAVGTHNPDTSLEHLAYHWAWTVRDLLGTQCVKAVGHSMGGLVMRYALARVQAGDPDFPSDICIDDAVGVATPNNGADQNKYIDACVFVSLAYECNQQQSGSDFLTGLGANARNPQGAGGTDWTNLGSDGMNGGDTSDSAGSATTANMDPAHHAVYHEQIKHSSPGTTYWKNAVSGTIDAQLDVGDAARGAGASPLANGPWPARFTDLSLAYTLWGCGTGALTSTWPLGNNLPVIGEPYTTDFHCWYYLQVPSGQGSLQVTVESLNGRDLDLYVFRDAVTGTPVCTQATFATSETCAFSNPPPGTYFVEVYNYAHTRDPFRLTAAYSTAVPDLTSTSLTSPPATVTTGQSYSLCWSVAGQGPITHTQVHWGTSSTSLPNASPVQAGSAPGSFCATLTAPSTPGTVYAQSHAVGPNDDLTSSQAIIYVLAPQNDCGTGGDAGNTHALATAVTPPKTNCQGYLITGDTNDWYQFTNGPGDTISATLTPPAGADFGLCLYTPAGAMQVCSNNAGSAAETVSFTTGSTTGAWRIWVSQTSGTGTYTLSLYLVAPQNDCGTGADAGNGFSTASSITLPKSNCQGALSPGDTQDWYQFTVNNGDQVTASMTPTGANADLCLSNPAGATVACSSSTGFTPDSITYTATTTGAWRLDAYIASGSGTYVLSASTGAPAQNDCGTGGDAGNSHAAASSITLPKSGCSGNLPTSDTQDWYQFSLLNGDQVSLSMTPPSGSDFNLCLLTPGGAVASCSTNTGSSAESVAYTATEAGAWRAQVVSSSGTGPYSFSALAVTPQNDCGTGADAGGSFATAATIALPQSGCQGAHPIAGDTQDWYQFTVNNGDQISASMTPATGANFDLCLSNPSGATVLCSSNTGSATDSIAYTATATGSWRLDTYIASGTGTYSLSVSTVTPQNDCGTGADAGNSHAAASAITLPKSGCSGALTATDTQDWYKFTVSSGDVISLSLSPPGGADFNLCLYNPSGSSVACSTLTGSSTDSVSYTANVAGDWRAYVYVASGTGTYSFSASAVTPQNDCGTGADAGGTSGTAATISVPQSNCQGAHPNAGDNMDWYQFYANTGDQISASMTPATGANFDLCLNTPAGGTVVCSSNTGSATDSVTYTATSSGYWKLDTYITSGTGTYTLSVSIVPAQNDCGTGADAGNSHAGASLIGLPQSGCSGALTATDTQDWFRFASNNGETISISVTPPAGANFNLCLYNPSGSSVACSTLTGSSTDSVSYTANVAGDWRA